MNDLHFAFRQLRENPGFTAVAVVTLALGLGRTTGAGDVVGSAIRMARNEALRDGRWMLATVRFVLAPAWRVTRVNPILALRSE
ncbi:MAG: hypothetical protein KJ072_10620 [Verrucomicrobia bacterium]|nr:hypothetical protein [Verrucomicrobiota bacterium]